MEFFIANIEIENSDIGQFWRDKLLMRFETVKECISSNFPIKILEFGKSYARNMFVLGKQTNVAEI